MFLPHGQLQLNPPSFLNNIKINQTGSLHFWVEADNSSSIDLASDAAEVTQWRDLSGKTRHLSENGASPVLISGSMAPIRGKAVQFTGSLNQFLQYAPGEGLEYQALCFTTSSTFGLVVKGISSGTCILNGVSASKGLSFGIDSNNRWQWSPCGATAFSSGPNGGAVDGQYHVVTFRTPNTNTTAEVRIDGAIVSASIAGSWNAVTGSLGGLSVIAGAMANPTAQPPYVSCRLAAAFISNIYVPTDVLKSIERWWGSKYGIPVG